MADKEKGKNTDLSEQMKEFQEALKNLPNDIAGNIANAVSSAITQANKAALEAARGSDDDEEDDMSPADIEKMSRADFSKFIVGNVMKEVKKIVKGIETKVDETSSKTDRVATERAWKEAQAKFKDLNDWIPEMEKKLSNDPAAAHMSPEDIYHSVRGSNPKKAAELDAKYKDGSEENKGEEVNKGKGTEEEASGPKAAFRGFTPTRPTTIAERTAGGSKKGGKSEDDDESDDDGPKKFATPRDAAEDAWDKTMKDLPAELLEGNID